MKMNEPVGKSGAMTDVGEVHVRRGRVPGRAGCADAWPRVMLHMVYPPPWLIQRQRNSQAFLDRWPPLRRALLDNWLDSPNSYNNVQALPFED